MSHSHRPAKLNVRALVILVAVTFLVGAGLVAGYYVRKRSLADRALMQAQAAVQCQDWPAASRHLRQYLEKYPRDAEQLERYAQAQLSVRPLEAGQIAGAIGAYRQLLRLRPGDTEVCRQLARLYAALGEHANAAYVCRQRLAVDPTDTGAALRLARALTAQNNRPEASALLTRIVEQHPHEIEAYTLLSTLALQDRSDSSHRTAQAWLDRAIDHNRDRAEAALAYAQRAWFRRTISQDMTGARDDLQSAAALAPRDPKVLLLLSDEWLAHHEFERSEAALAALRDSDTRAYLEDQVDPEALTYAQALARARCALARGAGETAVAVADQALRELSTRRRIIFLPLAVDLYIAGGRLPQARRCVDEYRAAVQSADSAVTATADDIALLDGIVLSAEGQTNAAIAVLAPLVERNPQLARAWKLLSLAYERTRQYRRSLAALEEYVARQPDPQALVQLACSYRQRDWRKVLKYARQAEQAGADEVDARVLRIEARLRSALGTLGPVQRAQLADELADLRIEHPRRGDVRM
ncbi:MAG TPA: tetratricopeptide repeat protein, partial [Phycisphaerae bacterium]